MAPSDRWARLRYDVLLAAASRGRALGRAYAELVGAVELWRGPERRRVAAARVARWLGCSAADGARVFHRSLVSEALEEADCARFMRDRTGLLESFRVAGHEPAHAGATIYATLHFGSPILAYVYLRCVRGIDLGIIGRRLDDANPMPAAKRRFGERKVAWLEAVTGRPLLGVDADAIARARGELVEGRSLYAAVDVPGDVAARVHEVVILGARVRLSSGILGLAALTGAAVQPVVATHRGGAIVVRYGAPIAGRRGAPPLAAAAEAIGALVRELPGGWWLWPYVTPAGA
jgi:hypothetical protein